MFARVSWMLSAELQVYGVYLLCVIRCVLAVLCTLLETTTGDPNGTS